MHKLRRRIVSDDSAKKARLLHRCNLALLGLLLCTTFLAGAHSPQQPEKDPAKRIELLSYEGQTVSSVELAGQPDLNVDELASLVAQHNGEDFSVAKIDETVAALLRTNKFTDVQIDLRPEQDGVRVVFILQPAIYFGLYEFPGAERFSYSRLIQASNYVQQEPYSKIDIDKAQQSLLVFLQRNGYFQAEVDPIVQVDKVNGLANVSFKVKLNRLAKFGEIQIQGPTPDEGEHLKSSLHSWRARLKLSAIKEGKSYSLKTLQNATAFLESQLQSENHLAATVKLMGANYNPETNRADILFDVQPGAIVHADVKGAHLWSWDRHKLLPVYQQNGLTPELIQEGRQNLLKKYREKGFFDVQVDAQTNERPDGILIVYTVKKGDRKKIEDVAFNGNTHFGEEDLEKHVNVKQARLLSKGSYDENSIKTLQAFYQSKGFNQVKVVPQFNTKGSNVVVTFVVNEGPQDTVNSFRVDGNSSVPINQLASDGLQLNVGQPYSQKNIDDDRNKIMAYYLEHGYLTATFHANASAAANDPHKFDVVYQIVEGPQVKTSSFVAIGNKVTDEALIAKQTETLKVGRPLTEREVLETESRLYATGIFDWAEVNPKRQITSQEQEAVIVKVHESKRNTLTYGFGYEMVSQGGSVPTGTVAVPGLPPIGLPSTFKTNQHTVAGPRVNLQYTLTNVRGKAETLTFAGLYGPLDRRLSLLFTDPNFRWTNWIATVTTSAEQNRENPLFNDRIGQAVFQLQKPLNPKRTQNLFLRYNFTETRLTNLAIPQLIPPEDMHTRLSTLGAVWTRDTRDNPLDAHTGMYDSLELDVNPAVLGSSANFGKLLMQAASYKKLNNIVWANSLRLGFLRALSGGHIPISQAFFSGGGSTLRGFPLNGAGPQNTVPACSNPSDTSTCSFIQVPAGGTELLILNSEFRIPVPLKKNLGFVMFYDGGNVFKHVSAATLGSQYSNSVGIGLRYSTPVGPVRIDLGHNLNPIPGIKATQIFITLGQAF
jgi:outer membrane protein assembly factor BamA